MGDSAALTIEYEKLSPNLFSWTLRLEGRWSVVSNGVESNMRKAKKAAQHAMRMATNQQKEK